MDLSNLVLDISEAFKKVYSIISIKPYADVKIRFTAPGDSPGKVTGDSIALTIINTGFGEIDLEKAWFLTSFNRPVSLESIDSKMPVKLPENDRVTYFLPVEEVKATLNKSIGDTITNAVVLDKKGHQFTGRTNESTQKELAK